MFGIDHVWLRVHEASVPCDLQLDWVPFRSDVTSNCPALLPASLSLCMLIHAPTCLFSLNIRPMLSSFRSMSVVFTAQIHFRTMFSHACSFGTIAKWHMSFSGEHALCRSSESLPFKWAKRPVAPWQQTPETKQHERKVVVWITMSQNVALFYCYFCLLFLFCCLRPLLGQ